LEDWKTAAGILLFDLKPLLLFVALLARLALSHELEGDLVVRSRDLSRWKPRELMITTRATILVPTMLSFFWRF
jgi:hypothetical protein